MGKRLRYSTTLWKLGIASISIILLFNAILFPQIGKSFNFSQYKVKIDKSKGKDGIQYQNFSLNECQNDNKPGKPMIPVKYVNLLIPSDANVNNISINIKSREKYNLEYKLFPGQPNITTRIRNKDDDFVKPDESIYNSDNPYPAKIVEIINDGFFDGSNHIITLAVYPIQYFPISNKIDVLTDFSFQLEYSGVARNNVRVKKRDYENQKLYGSILKSLIDNPEDIASYQVKPLEVTKKGLSKETSNLAYPPYHDYMIITTNSLQNSFTKFINWKKRKGVDIGLITIESILNTSSPGDLISGITDSRYINAGTLRMALQAMWLNGTTYVLLAGPPSNTGAGIPYMYGYNGMMGNILTDMYFADFDGDWKVNNDTYYGEPGYDRPDWQPEVFVGRVLCQNDQEVQNWVNKVIEYEQNPFKGDYSKVTKALWSSSDDMQKWNIDTHGIIGEPQYVSSSYVSSVFANNFYHKIIEEVANDPEFDKGYSDYIPVAPTGKEIIDELNQGYGFYNIYNHGEPTDVLVRCPGIHDMDSTTRLLYSDYYWTLYAKDSYVEPDPYNSESGNGLDNILPQNSSTIIYSTACDVAKYDLFNDGPYINTGKRCMADLFTTLPNSGGPAFLGNTNVGYVSCSFILHEYFIRKLFNDNIYNIGCAEALSKATYIENVLSYSHNLFGDPEMPVWTMYPSTSLSQTGITIGSNSVTVNPELQVEKICAASAGTNHGSSYYSISENVSSCTFNSSIRPLYITVTRHNYIPYIAITGGTLSSNDRWTGSLTVLGNVIVPAGVTLTIENGANIKFTNGASVVLSGGSLNDLRKSITPDISTECTLPKEYKLVGNYPNPFNPSTNIKYELPSESKVILKIYDALGREISELVNTIQGAGYYNVNFNGSNLSSGLYIYRISATSVNDGKIFDKATKMMYIK